ncbi:MAG: hypothetical protein M4579_001546 [Chaenotheca gracillima]|nr:MAG: hypothetical protein M4579_001546 [Chaenotheca gracillima]
MCNTCGKKKARILAERAQMATAANDAVRANVPEGSPVSSDVVAQVQQGKYSLQGLTINNYGSVSILSDTASHQAPVKEPATAGLSPATTEQDDRLPQGPPPDYIRPTVFDSLGRVVRSSYDYTARIQFKNTFPVNLTEVRLVHQYGGDEPHQQIWKNLGPNTTSSADLYAGFNTGVFSRYDSWWLEIRFDDGEKFNTGWKQCYLEEKDKQENGILTFSITNGEFFIDLRSAKNDFPIATTLTLTHKYSHEKETATQFGGVLQPYTRSSSYWHVYFGTGNLRGDYWNIQASMQGVPRQGMNWEVSNRDGDYSFWLESIDVGKAVICQADCAGWKLLFESGKTDYLDWWTPQRLTSVALVQIRNNFKQDITSIILTHEHSGSAKLSYEYPGIQRGEVSETKVPIEFSTGALSGFDYWDIAVDLADGRQFRNSKHRKECYLEREDADLLTFTVSETKFDIALEDPCTDGMQDVNQKLGLGADATKPYNKNCFLTWRNAFASSPGYIDVANRSLGLSDTFAFGASAFLLELRVRDDEIFIRNRTGRKNEKPTLLSEGLQQINAMLQRFPDVIITLMIEDKLGQADDQRARLEDIFKRAHLWNQIYWPASGLRNKDWPTLNEMKSSGHRLVVFTTVRRAKASFAQFPYKWDFITENMPGEASMDPLTWTKLHEESQSVGKSSLLALNRQMPPRVVETDASPNDLSLTPKLGLLEHVRAFHGHIPNFLVLDKFALDQIPSEEEGPEETKICNDAFRGRPLPSPDAPEESADNVDSKVATSEVKSISESDNEGWDSDL